MQYLAIIYNDRSLRERDARGHRRDPRPRQFGEDSATRACSSAASLQGRARRRRSGVRDGERLLDGPYAETKSRSAATTVDCKDLTTTRSTGLADSEAKGAMRCGRSWTTRRWSRRQRRQTARLAGPQSVLVDRLFRASRDGRSPRPSSGPTAPGGGPERALVALERRSAACRRTRPPGSSPPRATVRSTGSGASAGGRAAAPPWRPSCARSAAARTRTTSRCPRSPTSGCG